MLNATRDHFGGVAVQRSLVSSKLTTGSQCIETQPQIIIMRISMPYVSNHTRNLDHREYIWPKLLSCATESAGKYPSDAIYFEVSWPFLLPVSYIPWTFCSATRTFVLIPQAHTWITSSSWKICDDWYLPADHKKLRTVGLCAAARTSWTNITFKTSSHNKHVNNKL